MNEKAKLSSFIILCDTRETIKKGVDYMAYMLNTSTFTHRQHACNDAFSIARPVNESQAHGLFWSIDDDLFQCNPKP